MSKTSLKFHKNLADKPKCRKGQRQSTYKVVPAESGCFFSELDDSYVFRSPLSIDETSELVYYAAALFVQMGPNLNSFFHHSALCLAEVCFYNPDVIQNFDIKGDIVPADLPLCEACAERFQEQFSDVKTEKSVTKH